jgi:hypothetical protein
MTRPLGILLTALLLSCAPAATPPPRVEPPPPRLAATAVAKRVVLVSFDGLGADALARQQHLPSFERLAREGASARVITVNPTLTMPAHVSFLTGADPQRHGIVANRLHLPGTPPEQVARGMNLDPDVETLIEAARRQGKRVGTVSFPTIDNSTPRRSADFGLAWSTPLVPARIVQLRRNDFKREWVPPTWSERPQRRRSYSPVMRARVEWSVPRVTRADVDVVAYDTTDDGRENYDTYFVEHSEREFDAREWFPVSRQTSTGVHGSWSKVLSTTPSLNVTIYCGSIARNMAWPASFRDLLDEEAGFWPGEPEKDLEVDPILFRDQLVRLAEFYKRAQVLAIQRMQFDLLLAYQPQIDEASHSYLGTPTGDAVIRDAFTVADRNLGEIAEAMDPEDALVVMGDHGLVPVEREVLINRLLTDRGFGPRWRAYTSGAHAQFYRFEGPDDSDALVDMLNATGLFERVEKKTAAIHPRNGDVVAYALPGVALTAGDEEEHPGGQHGGLNTHRELHAVLFAYGRGVAPGALGEISQTRIARYVAELLGITPPSAAE